MTSKQLIKKNIERMQKELGDKYWKVSASGIWFKKLFPEILERHSEGKLLDVGAGKNLLYKDILSSYCEEYESLDIIDNSSIDYQQDIRDMKLDSETYDTVFCRNVLEHIKNPREALKEIARILKKDGKVIITVPHLAYLHNEPGDYYRFTKYGIKHLIEETDMEIIEIKEAGGLFSFLGYIFSTGFLGLTYHIPIISDIAYYLNYPLQILALKLDKITKNKRFLPLNYILVAEK